MITSAQIRGARAMLELSQTDLAKAAGLSKTAIGDFEMGISRPKTSTLASMQRALEIAGVIFIDENGEGPGIRLKKAR
jgi:DNA-binding XRE family transcriptional regulator